MLCESFEYRVAQCSLVKVVYIVFLLQVNTLNWSLQVVV